MQVGEQFRDRRWISNIAVTAKDGSGKGRDPAAGITTLLSNIMTDKVVDSRHVATRIAWVGLAGPTCNIFFVVIHVSHKGITRST